MPTTLVTGSTGFLAGHCVDQLLKSGHTVIGTVRNPDKAQKLAETFKSAIESGKLELETLQDIRDETEFKAIFLKHPEIRYILHTASPFNFHVKDPVKDMLEPAILGTTTVLQTAKAYAPNVKKIVITSSLAAIMDVEKYSDPRFVLTEADWNPMSYEEAAEQGNSFNNYVGSKLLAERASLNFIESSSAQFKLTWINPTYILGPSVSAMDRDALNTSNEVIVNALESKRGETPTVTAGWFVDVRDCAKAHVEALQPDLDGKRLLLSTAKFCTQDLLDIANKISHLHGKIATGDKHNRQKELDTTCQVDNAATRHDLNIDWIPLKKSVTDFAHQWLELR